jgi:hypothetical protein
MPHPASIKVQVTRKVGSPDVSDETYQRYQLSVGAFGTNPYYPADKSISVPVNYPRDSSTYALMCGMAPDEAHVTLSDQLGGWLFSPSVPGKPVGILPYNLINPDLQKVGPPAPPVTIPRLKPGESTVISVPLAPSQPFWIPGHKEAIQKAGGAVCFDDWYTLYQGGQLTARAGITCPAQNQWMTCSMDKPAVSELKQEIPW